MKYFFIVFVIVIFGLFSVHQTYATLDDPVPGGVGRNSVTTLEDVLNMLFGGGSNPYYDYPDPDPDGAYPTATPTYPPGTTPPITPQITTPPSLTGEGQYADEVVRYANQYCGGVISRNNYNCVDSFAPIMNAGARQELKYSAAAYTYAQCVAGARSMAKARNRPYNGFGNAIQHAVDGQDANYTYYPRAQASCSNLVPGSLFIQNIGAYGHIGYVTDVQGCKNKVGTPGSITAFEVNFGPGTVKHGRIIPLSEIFGWQKPNSL